jgi:hypothetical protein
MTYMWTDPAVVRAVAADRRPKPRRRTDPATRRVLVPAVRVRLPGISQARPTEARGV